MLQYFLRRLLPKYVTLILLAILSITITTYAKNGDDVSAELGGLGFEKIAEAQGFVTYIPKQEELKYFGDPRAKTGGMLSITTSRFPIVLRPLGQNSNYVENSYIGAMVYETLLGTHPITREFVPALATHWKISKDRKTFIFRIDPNARFSNGKPVTANDFVASWRLTMDESILEPSSQLVYGKFEEPKSLSKYLLQVKAKSLNFRNLLYFAGNLYAFSADEIGNITGSEFIEKYQFVMPVGSGEYIIKPEDVKVGESYALTRLDNYWRRDYETSKYNGNFDKIIFNVNNMDYEPFKKGQSDIYRYAMNSTDAWLYDAEDDPITKGWIQRRRVLNDSPFGVSGYGFNLRKPPFDDIRIRKAFAYLHNRESIISNLLFDEYIPIDSYYSNSVYANPDNPKTRYNPEIAAKLLKEAGWSKKNENGILTKNGKPFVIEIGINKNFQRFVESYQNDLREAGIDLQITFQDGNRLFSNAMDRNFTIWYANWGGLLTPNPETSLKSSLADQQDNNNVEGFKNARVDQLLDAYDTTFSITQQIKIIKEIDKIQMDTYIHALSWNPNGISMSYWDKFGMPEWILGKYTQLGYLELEIMNSWWYDEAKAENLETAMKNKTIIANPTEIVEVDYWKKFSK